MMHTPGPWKAIKASHGVIDVFGDNETRDVLTIYGRNPEQEANARLIAAAPDMLAALKAAEIAVEQLCHDQHPDNQCWATLREVRAAIAKATGGQS